MASKFNPNRPNIAGDEWYGGLNFAPAPNSGVTYGATFTATVTETIDHIDTIIKGATGAPPSVICEVYPTASVVNDETWIMTKPVSDVSSGPDWQQYNAGTFSAYGPSAYTFIDDIVAQNTNPTASATDMLVYGGLNPASPSIIMFKANQSAGMYDGVTGASGQTLSGKRCRWVEIIATCENFTDHSVRFDGYLQIGTTLYSSTTGPQIAPAAPGITRYGFGFYLNPFTANLPWNQADVVNLTNSTNAFGIGVSTKSGAGSFGITALSLEFHVCTEARLAVGFASGSATNDLWANFALVAASDFSTPTNWSKVSGTKYSVYFTPYAGSLVLAGVNTANVRPGHESDALPTGTTFTRCYLQPGLVPSDASGGESPGQLACLLEHSGAASVDSNPYASVSAYSLGADGATTATQGISIGSAQAYGVIGVVAALTPNGGGGALQNAPMTVSLKRTSDNAVLLGPATVNVADVPPDGYFHLITLGLTPSTLTNLEAVYVECDSTSTVGWILPALYTRYGNISAADAKVVLANAVGIGGTSDRGNADNGLDFPFWMGVAPATPSGLVVTQGTFSAAQASPCGPTSLHYAAVDWTTTALGGGFGYYELQRSDDNTTWATIAKITTEAASNFNDTECLRGKIQYYRLRVVASNGGISLFTASVNITITTPGNADVILTSNFDPVRSLGYQEDGNADPVHVFTRANANSTVKHLIAGRQTPIAFRPLIEGNSDVTGKTLIIAADNPGVPVANTSTDRAAFDALLALIEDTTVPYICVCDGRGRRWFAFVEYVQGSYTWKGHMHQAQILMTEVSTVPSVLTTTSPPVP